MADEQVQKGAAAIQENVRHNYDSAKATIRHATRGGEISHEGIRRVYCMKGKTFDRGVDSMLSGKEQTKMGRRRSGHHPELKYWMHKIRHAVGTICRICRIGE